VCVISSPAYSLPRGRVDSAFSDPTGQAISIVRRIAGAASARTLTTDDPGQVTW